MDDLINRQDVVDAIVKWTVEDRPNEVMPTDLIDRVNALPSAGRDGKWLNHYCDEDGYVDGIECSCCRDWWYVGRNLPNYCPNCGADMRGEENE